SSAREHGRPKLRNPASSWSISAQPARSSSTPIASGWCRSTHASSLPSSATLRVYFMVRAGSAGLPIDGAAQLVRQRGEASLQAAALDPRGGSIDDRHIAFVDLPLLAEDRAAELA